VQVSDSLYVDTGASGAYALMAPPGPVTVYVTRTGFESDSAISDVQIDRLHYAHFQLVPSDPLATLWYGCAAPSIPAGKKSVLPHRLISRDLWVTDSGRWIIRTQEEWEAFWQKYRDPRRSPAQRPPEVNWAEAIVIAVGEGGSSGCSNAARYINRIVVSGESTEVILGPEERGIEITCMMSIAPVDVIVVPRHHYGPVVFRKLEPKYRRRPR
jgi:hypothetical protein